MNVSGLRYLAAGLLLAVAATHLYWGFPRLVTQIQIGIVHDPRPPVFVLSGTAIVLGIARVLDGANPRPLYLVGIALMLGYIAGYAAWHTVLGHGAFWPWGLGGDGLHYDMGFVELMITHLSVETTAAISKVFEIAAAIVLTILYVFDEEPTKSSPPIPAREDGYEG